MSYTRERADIVLQDELHVWYLIFSHTPQLFDNPQNFDAKSPIVQLFSQFVVLY